VDRLALNQFLMLYTWFMLTGLLFFLLLIARFYQKFSGTQTYFRLFMVPVVLFGVSAVRYASIGQVAGDPLADLTTAIAGLILLALSWVLYRHMLSSE
jgi:hypothetical protein